MWNKENKNPQYHSVKDALLSTTASLLKEHASSRTEEEMMASKLESISKEKRSIEESAESIIQKIRALRSDVIQQFQSMNSIVFGVSSSETVKLKMGQHFQSLKESFGQNAVAVDSMEESLKSKSQQLERYENTLQEYESLLQKRELELTKELNRNKCLQSQMEGLELKKRDAKQDKEKVVQENEHSTVMVKERIQWIEEKEMEMENKCRQKENTKLEQERLENLFKDLKEEKKVQEDGLEALKLMYLKMKKEECARLEEFIQQTKARLRSKKENLVKEKREKSAQLQEIEDAIRDLDCYLEKKESLKKDTKRNLRREELQYQNATYEEREALSSLTKENELLSEYSADLSGLEEDCMKEKEICEALGKGYEERGLMIEQDIQRVESEIVCEKEKHNHILLECEELSQQLGDLEREVQEKKKEVSNVDNDLRETLLRIQDSTEESSATDDQTQTDMKLLLEEKLNVQFSIREKEKEIEKLEQKLGERDIALTLARLKEEENQQKNEKIKEIDNKYKNLRCEEMEKLEFELNELVSKYYQRKQEIEEILKKPSLTTELHDFTNLFDEKRREVSEFEQETESTEVHYLNHQKGGTTIESTSRSQVSSHSQEKRKSKRSAPRAKTSKIPRKIMVGKKRAKENEDMSVFDFPV